MIHADVVAVAISILPCMQEFGLKKLWIALIWLTKWIPMHDKANYSVGPEKTIVESFLHGVSAFCVV